MEDKREYYLDVLRILAIIGVILIHISGNLVVDRPASNSWHYGNILMTISRPCVPIFIMISGSIFLNSKKSYDMKYLYGKKIFRLLMCLLVWGYIYNLVGFITPRNTGEWGFRLLYLVDALKKTLMGITNYHLWYLYVILGLYILTPIIKKLIDNFSEKDILYSLGIWIFFASIIPFLTHFALFKYLGLFINIGNSLFSNFTIYAGYIGYYILGYYLSNKKFSKKQLNYIYISGIISLLIMFTLVTISLYKSGGYNPFFHEYKMPYVVVLSVSIFVFLKEYFNKIELKDKTKKVLIFLSSMTFGIYLVHDLFLGHFPIFGMTYKSVFNNTLVTTPLYFILVLSASALVTYMLSKIPIIKKYII